MEILEYLLGNIGNSKKLYEVVSKDQECLKGFEYITMDKIF